MYNDMRAQTPVQHLRSRSPHERPHDNPRDKKMLAMDTLNADRHTSRRQCRKKRYQDQRGKASGNVVAAIPTPCQRIKSFYRDPSYLQAPQNISLEWPSALASP